jgi:hypothetical protein
MPILGCEREADGGLTGTPTDTRRTPRNAVVLISSATPCTAAMRSCPARGGQALYRRRPARPSIRALSLSPEVLPMPRPRPPYSPEFRRQMVDLVRAGRSPDDLAREFEPSGGKPNGEPEPLSSLKVGPQVRIRLPPAARLERTCDSLDQGATTARKIDPRNRFVADSPLEEGVTSEAI